MVARSASKDRSRDRTQDQVVVAKNAFKDRSRDKTQEQDRSEVESLPSPPRRKRGDHTKRDPPPSEDEEHSVSTTSALSLGVTESKTKVKVRLRRFFSRKSPQSPKSPRIPQPSTFDILEDLSFTEDVISRSTSSRLSRKSYIGNSHSSEDNKVVSTEDNSASALDRNIDEILENREDGSIASMESDGNVEVYEIAKALHSTNSWSDRVKDARRYYPSSPLSLAKAERRGLLLTPVQELLKSEDEKSEANATDFFLLSRTSNDQPGDNAMEESPWKSEMTEYRDENLEESRNREHDILHDDCLREDFPRSEHTHLPEEYLEDGLSRNEESDLQKNLTSGSAATNLTTETTLLTVEQLKRDLELFSLENVAERMQCQRPGTNGKHSKAHKTDHVFPSKPWCYASEHLEVRSEASAAPGSDRMFGCMALPELYTSSSPPMSPNNHRDSEFVQVAHGHPGMNIMSDITSFAISQTSTGSGSFSEDTTTVHTVDQSDMGLDTATSGHTTFTGDSESLSVQTDDELSQTEDDDFTQTEDDDFTQTEDDSDSSVSTASAPKTGQFMNWMGSPVSSNSDSDSDSDSCTTVHAPSKETKDPTLFKWLHGN
jgi:hypothetical protein